MLVTNNNSSLCSRGRFTSPLSPTGRLRSGDSIQCVVHHHPRRRHGWTGRQAGASHHRLLPRTPPTTLHSRPGSCMGSDLQPAQATDELPKHHLVDPAIAARLLGVGKDGLLRGEGNRVARATGTWLGALFKSLATQSIRVYAEASSASVAHLRTKDGVREIDLIIEGSDRQVVAIEVKLAATIEDHDVRHHRHLCLPSPRRCCRRSTRASRAVTGPSRFRRDSAGDPFEAEISQHRPTAKIDVSAGQTVFARVAQHRPTPSGEFELYSDI